LGNWTIAISKERENVKKICQAGKPTRGREIVPFHCRILQEHTHELPRLKNQDGYEIASRLNRIKMRILVPFHRRHLIMNRSFRVSDNCSLAETHHKIISYIAYMYQLIEVHILRLCTLEIS
jgi:hypothetical protein